MKEDFITVWHTDGVTSELIDLFLGCFYLQSFMFGASSSNQTPTPTPEETMEADGSSSSGNMFVPPGKIYLVFLPFLFKTALHFLIIKPLKTVSVR